MAQALSTYSIESEQTIVLSFIDGSCVRCSPELLSQHLSRKDLERVSKALMLRKNFIRRVLPPVALVGMLISTAFLAQHDYNLYVRSDDRPQSERSMGLSQEASTSNVVLQQPAELGREGVPFLPLVSPAPPGGTDMVIRQEPRPTSSHNKDSREVKQLKLSETDAASTPKAIESKKSITKEKDNAKR